MISSELKLGRTFGITIKNGEDFFTALEKFREEHDVKQGYVQSFVGAFRNAEIIGTNQKIKDKEAPDPSSVYLEAVEVVGSGTFAYDEKKEKVSYNIHVSAGLRTHSASAYTGHLCRGEIQFLTELLLIEVLEPSMVRQIDKNYYNIPVLNYIGC